MKSPLFKSAPALAVILALTSTSAFASSRRTGGTLTENRAAAQSTAAQSAQQQGSVDSDSSAQGAARRTRTGSFVSASSTTKEVKDSKKDREVRAHIADVEAFLRDAGGSFSAPLVEGYITSAKQLILNGPTDPKHSEMYAFVEKLAKTDEKALEALFYFHSIYGSALLFKMDKPEFATAIDRLGAKLSEAGIVTNFDGVSFTIDPISASAILTAPRARALLHKHVGSTMIRKGSHAALAIESVSEQGSLTFTHESEFYPTQSAAVSKTSRYSTKIAYATGAETRMSFDLHFQNLEPNGLKSAIWELSDEAVLSMEDRAASVGSKQILLSFNGISYPKGMSATERDLKYTGKVTLDGVTYSVVANVLQKDTSSDSFNPKWEFAKETLISIEPKK